MILHMGGGGGAAGLKMDITGGTVQPTGVENRIWINTATAIGTVTVDSAAPSSTAAGDVYIELDPASSAVVQVGNVSRIVMLPLGIAYQYQSGAWVSLDAYAYLSGAWVTFSTDIPDGDTTTPVNDTNTWLRCAGINPSAEGNPTLAQVVASSTLCATLMGSANAVNYMIRSTTIQTAALGSATAISALDSSSPFVSAVMTSNSAPIGYVATASSEQYGAAYKLTTAAGYWALQAAVGAWCAIQMPEAFWLYKVQASICTNNEPNYYSVTWKVQGSNDGSTWTDVTGAVTSSVLATNVAVARTTQYSRYRLYITAWGVGGTPVIMGKNLVAYGKKREVI